MRVSSLAVFLLTFCCINAVQATVDKILCNNADKLLINAQFITMDPNKPDANALAITQERIVGVGDKNELLTVCRGTNTQVINLNGDTVTPGFIDTYSHFLLFGWLSENALDLSSTNALHKKDWKAVKNINEFLTSIKENLGKKEQDWMVVFGYDPSRIKGKHLTIEDLNAITNQEPLLIIYNSPQIVQLNTAGIEKIRQMIPSLEIPDNGVLHGQNLNQLFSQLIDHETAKNAIQKSASFYSQQGYTTITESQGLNQWLPLYNSFTSNGNFPLDVIFNSDSINTKKRMELIYQDNPRLFSGPVILSLDNSLQGYSALLTANYYQPHPEKGNSWRGSLNQSPQQIDETLNIAAKQKISLGIESQGDAATDYALNRIQSIQMKDDKSFKPIFINSAYVRADQMARMQKLSIKVNWFTPQLYYWGESLCHEVLGPQRANQLLPLASAKNTFNHLSFHANSPSSPPIPLDIMKQATERNVQSWNYPYNTHCPESLGAIEKISTMDALNAFTLGAAELYGLQKEKGSLEVGKLADMTILSSNPLDSLENSQVKGTIIRGQLRWNNPELTQPLTR
ncbi:N-substituted formamide deformylase precursor (plasmid) [Legionella adelaidensis]|uniref:N-substituted formamide deformylase n=1 Tax=Legionella adelaidensis TaxID=45056 RepID=A0A0W0R5Y9_9GAMM|nr:amidohydrolase family protein [Legionella adelaidensis]KTC66477.1 N-substituted formamide deformylase precursor [Legionella adelaidensis]VEH86235.1 N-substituted formamide deformylase precursor [Legionella adelaidensis]